MRSLDEAFEDVGDFGAYQKKLYYFLLITATFPVMQKWLWDFMIITPPHRCKFPFEVISNSTDYTEVNVNSEITAQIESISQLQPCTTYHVDNLSDILMWNKTMLYNSTQQCSSWIYDTSDERTLGIVAEFNLVCDRSHFLKLSKEIYMWCELSGYLFWGLLSDRFGRKKVFFISLMFQALSGFLAGMVTSLSGIIAMRGALAFFTSGCLIGGILRMEFIGPSMRMVTAMMDCAMASAGQLLIAFLIVLLSKWRHLQIVTTIPSFLFLSCWWFVPESARWLLAHKNEREARRIISKMANKNRRELTIDSYESVRDKPKMIKLTDFISQIPSTSAAFQKLEQDSLFYQLCGINNHSRIFTHTSSWTKNMRKNTGLVSVWLFNAYNCLFCDIFNFYPNFPSFWLAFAKKMTGTASQSETMMLTNGISFYSISQKWMPEIHDDPLVNFVVNAFIEQPAFIMSLFTLNRFGRRFPIGVAMVSTAVLLTLYIAIPSNLSQLSLIALIFSKISSTAVFASLYVYSMELQSTALRGAALGIMFSCHLIGQVITLPIQYLSDIWEPLPVVFTAALSGVIGFLIFLLPETTGYYMPDRLQDVEIDRSEEDENEEENVFSGRRVSLYLRNPTPLFKKKEINQEVNQDFVQL